MAVSENLQFLRARAGLTQEQLAEELNVSRQSVSKWESGASYPETDTLLRLCGKYGVDLDTLMRGDVRQALAEDGAGYDRHMNSFARAIAGGVGLVLGGVTLLLAMVGLGGDGTVGTLLFLSLLAAAVVIFILAAMGHDRFTRKNPVIQPFYSEEQIDRFEGRFPLLIALPVALILVGVICMTALLLQAPPAGLTEDQWAGWAAASLLLCITAATVTLVWAGIQKAKYDIPAYNRERVPNPASRRSEALWGCGMVGATAVYVGLGLTLNLWDRAWVIYPVAALVCVAVSIYLKRNEDD